MNKKIIILVIVLGFIAFMFWSKNKATVNDPAKVLAGQTMKEETIDFYTCGMHPSVRVMPGQYNKGDTLCPICNMKLVPVYKETKTQSGGKKILFYRHPDDPSITTLTPTQDQEGRYFIPVYETTESDALYYGCGMKGQEHVFMIKGLKGMSCPICGMNLIELSKEEADSLTGVVGRVSIKGEQARLAGVKTELVTKQHLYKQIRIVGKVAYDPELVIAEEEFISVLVALDKIKEGNIGEIIERSEKLVSSSKRKLRLLGLSDEQIKNLEETRKIHTSLILPEEKAWIYGDVYEYESGWVKSGSEVTVTATSLAGEVFSGVVASVNPVFDSKTRSVTFRAQVNNTNLRLKPEMYVDVVISTMYMNPEGDSKVIAIPKEALLDTGTRKIVWIDKQTGEYEGREIEVGPEAVATVNGKESKFYPVVKGLVEGEVIVTRANFLIDSQSQLSGAASAAYGGSLAPESGTMPLGHQM
jgi:membrane fusion protein, copper/silver efflux system